MRSLVIFLLLCLSYNALSVPTSKQQGRSFQVERLRRSDYVAHGPTALQKAYRKYGMPMTFDTPYQSYQMSSKSETETDEAGEVSATLVQGGSEYVSPVVIGGQTFNMDFDTGSSTMWVMNTYTGLTTWDGVNRAVYNSTQSKTFKLLENGYFMDVYGDASYNYGFVGIDTVSIGGVSVTDQVFGLPTEVSSQFEDNPSSDGLVGLAFESLNSIVPGPQKTFFDNVEPRLEEPVLTALLRVDGVSEYEFGKIDHSKYTGTLANISVDSSRGYWEFDVGNFKAGNVELSSSKNTRAIADTGTTLLLASSDIVSAYYQQVPGSSFSSSFQGYVFPCTADLPDLHVTLGDNFPVTVPGAMLNYSTTSLTPTASETECFGGLQSSQAGLQIFGDLFLRLFFVVFDKRGPSLGFASPK
ncbi:aspergillopepsin A-like aspartic endopeptidase [Penicillium lagena]|uniref:aspergillopepsin A-like aspartic endopeptidase n=1 Tax=Penicillium lagena TaxID=94218 RepID=UPI00254169F1|nr:aspergillopepsin A-like aspartic endopeptidase [Penicillium lagena]KAJ5610964.1 aspergillopepsin A-like aspartic endopeptidase [Penicillium lagena]